MTSGRTIVHRRITTLCFPSFSLLVALCPLACAQGQIGTDLGKGVLAEVKTESWE